MLPHLFHGDTLGACIEPPEVPTRFVVEEEPPGANCPAGGIRLIVIHGERDGARDRAAADAHPPMPPDPPDEVFYICNGVDGEDGEPGPTRPARPARRRRRARCARRPWGARCRGAPGAPGQLPTCTVTRRFSPLILPNRARRQTPFPTSGRVRIRINGGTQVRRVRGPGPTAGSSRSCGCHASAASTRSRCRPAAACPPSTSGFCVAATAREIHRR